MENSRETEVFTDREVIIKTLQDDNFEVTKKDYLNLVSTRDNVFAYSHVKKLRVCSAQLLGAINDEEFLEASKRFVIQVLKEVSGERRIKKDILS